MLMLASLIMSLSKKVRSLGGYQCVCYCGRQQIKKMRKKKEKRKKKERKKESEEKKMRPRKNCTLENMENPIKDKYWKKTKKKKGIGEEK